MSSIAFPYSIDTVKLVIPVAPGTHELFIQKIHSKGFDLAKFQEYEKVSCYFWPIESVDQLPSHWSPPQFSMESNYMVFKFSLPKLLYGHSARHAWDLRPALEGLALMLRKFGVRVTAPWARWQIRELHVSWNFELESKEFAEQTYDQLKRLRYLGKYGHVKGREQYAWWPGESKTVKFYLKGPEMRKHRGDYPEPWLNQHREQLDRVLRYEEEWKGPALLRFCGVESTSEVTAGRVLAAFSTSWNQEKFLSKVSKRFTHPRPKKTLEDIQLEIRQTFRKSEPICQFAYAVSKLGIKTVKKSMKEQTFYNNQRYLKKIGVEVSHLEHLYDTKWLGDAVDLSGILDPEKLFFGMDSELIEQGPVYALWRSCILESTTKSKNRRLQKVVHAVS